MIDENKLKQIKEKYYDEWQKLYQEYSYAFKDYNEYLLLINNYLIDNFKIYSDESKTKKHCLIGAKRYIQGFIHNKLANNKIDILLNYITSNIEVVNNPDENLKKIINFIESFNYTPSPNGKK